MGSEFVRDEWLDRELGRLTDYLADNGMGEPGQLCVDVAIAEIDRLRQQLADAEACIELKNIELEGWRGNSQIFADNADAVRALRQQLAAREVQSRLQQHRVEVAEVLVDDPAADVRGLGDLGDRDRRRAAFGDQVECCPQHGGTGAAHPWITRNLTLVQIHTADRAQVLLSSQVLLI